MSVAFLVAALVAGGAGLAIGLPAWRTWQARAVTDRNAERYLAWRGRADRSPAGAQEMTSGERRRIITGAVLVVVAIACLIIGLTSG